MACRFIVNTCSNDLKMNVTNHENTTDLPQGRISGDVFRWLHLVFGLCGMAVSSLVVVAVLRSSRMRTPMKICFASLATGDCTVAVSVGVSVWFEETGLLGGWAACPVLLALGGISSQSSILGVLVIGIKWWMQLIQWNTNSSTRSKRISVIMVVIAWLCAFLMTAISLIWRKAVNNEPCYLDFYLLGLPRSLFVAVSGAVLLATAYFFVQFLRYTIRMCQYEREKLARNLIRRADFREQLPRLPCPAERHSFIETMMRTRDLAIQDEAEERERLEDVQVHNTIVVLMVVLMILWLPLHIVAFIQLFHPLLDAEAFRMWTLAAMQLNSLMKSSVCLWVSKWLRQSVAGLFSSIQTRSCCKVGLQPEDIIRMYRI